jgi:hypothetical protein
LKNSAFATHMSDEETTTLEAELYEDIYDIIAASINTDGWVGPVEANIELKYSAIL